MKKPILQTTMTTKFELEVDNEALIAAVRAFNPGLVIPKDARVWIDVPGGGDWAGMELFVDDECPIRLRWEVKEPV